MRKEAGFIMCDIIDLNVLATVLHQKKKENNANNNEKTKKQKQNMDSKNFSSILISAEKKALSTLSILFSHLN